MLAVAEACVAVAVGQGRGQGDEVVGGQADRLVGVGGIGMDYRPDLVEGDRAVRVDRDGEHDGPVGAGTADHLATLEAQRLAGDEAQHHRAAALDAQHYGFAAGGVDEAGRTGIDAERVGDVARRCHRHRTRW